MRRDKISAKVREHISWLYLMIWQSYANASNLYFGDEYIIESEERVQQGDPLGPMLFSLGLMDLVRSCEPKLSGWYLDDGSLEGRPDEVLTDLQRVLEMSSELGLQVNPTKCELFFTN